MALTIPASSHQVRLFGLIMIFAGIGGWYYNHHLAAAEGEFYIRLFVFAPLGIFGGILLLLRPEWVGPIRKNSLRAQKVSLGVVIGLMAVISGIDMYLLTRTRAPERFHAPSRTNWSPDLGTPAR